MTFLIIENHSRIRGLDEKEVGKKEHPSFRELFLNNMLGYKTCRKLPTQSADKNNVKRYYKNAKIVWLIRNPLDTVQSMKNLSYKGWDGNWIQEAAHIEINNLERMFPDAKALTKNCEIEIGARIWKLNHMAMEEFKDSGLDVIKVKYENVLQNTKSEVKRIFGRLKLDYEEKAMKYHNEEKNEERNLSGKTDASEGINRTNVNKKINMTEAEIEKVKQVCKNRAEKEGYEIKQW